MNVKGKIYFACLVFFIGLPLSFLTVLALETHWYFIFGMLAFYVFSIFSTLKMGSGRMFYGMVAGIFGFLYITALPKGRHDALIEGFETEATLIVMWLIASMAIYYYGKKIKIKNSQ